MIGLRVLTIGTFDLFHRGHGELLHRAASFGRLHVGVNSDRFVKTYKGRAPIQGEQDRLWHVRQFNVVHAAAISHGSGIDLIRGMRPDLLVVGSDWHGHYFEQLRTTPEEMFDELRCGVIYLPRTPGVSSSELRR